MLLYTLFKSETKKNATLLFVELSAVTWGARGVMVSVAGYGHGDTSSNPGPDWLHFT